MKITAQEEYGLRILVRIASCKDAAGITIPQLSELEGLTSHYVAKLTRTLRIAGYINSTRGYKGGYVLAQPAEQIIIGRVLEALGGNLFDKKFCGTHAGSVRLCTNSVDCSVRSLWQIVQTSVDNVLDKITLHHLVNPEKESAMVLQQILQQGLRAPVL
ncbi:MAG: Rrf2 family transcriptional regulator [Chitinophagaceae bacterium]